MNQGYNRDDVWNLRRASETALAEDLGPELFELGGVYDVVLSDPTSPLRPDCLAALDRRLSRTR